MKNVLIGLITFFVIYYSGCCSSDKSRSSENVRENITETEKNPKIIKTPTAIKSNTVKVECTVDTVIFIDEINFRLLVNVLSVAPLENVDAIMDVGEQLNLTPEFFIGEDNKIDKQQERNVKLLELRSLKRGGKFNGIISLKSNGQWVLTDIINDK